MSWEGTVYVAVAGNRNKTHSHTLVQGYSVLSSLPLSLRGEPLFLGVLVTHRAWRWLAWHCGSLPRGQNFPGVTLVNTKTVAHISQTCLESPAARVWGGATEERFPLPGDKDRSHFRCKMKGSGEAAESRHLTHFSLLLFPDLMGASRALASAMHFSCVAMGREPSLCTGLKKEAGKTGPDEW